MVRWLTAGESHGKGLTAIVEGLPAGLLIDLEEINFHLARRQMGSGRGGRMSIERDKVDVLSGIRFGKTTGSPVTLWIGNRDHENHLSAMSVTGSRPEEEKAVRRPRPGHADLAGMLKYGLHDARDVAERASARETAARVAVGGLFRLFLRTLGIEVQAHVLEVGGIRASLPADVKIEMIRKTLGRDMVGCIDHTAWDSIELLMAETREQGDTLGGVFEVIAEGVPPGLGSYIQWDHRADSQLAAAFMGIPSVKGVEIGAGFSLARRRGLEARDEFVFTGEDRCNDLSARATNQAGGLEGGVTNGQPIIVRAAVKPIPTLSRETETVDLDTRERVITPSPRADVCVLEAVSVVGEAAMLNVLAVLVLEKFGGDSMDKVVARVDRHREEVSRMV
ncbi:MAG: chorismate synthase [bacterium]|jgi:chorismate synthase|nr:chorismate synthase [bacterium]